jgi:hypothetical protein
MNEITAATAVHWVARVRFSNPIMTTNMSIKMVQAIADHKRIDLRPNRSIVLGRI